MDRSVPTVTNGLPRQGLAQSVRNNAQQNGAPTRNLQAATGTLPNDVNQQACMYPADFLPYPNDYFHPLTGCNRKNRQTDGLSDRSIPDGAKMLEEIQATRESLRTDVLNEFKKGICEVAREKDLSMRGRSASPVHLVD